MGKKTLIKLLLSFVLIVTCFAMPVWADETEGLEEVPSSEPLPITATEGPATYSPIDWSNYSYEELLSIRDNLNTFIGELERQYAIENGNRIITLNNAAPVIYKGKTFAFETEVTRIVEDAPENTDFVWTSSDESIARVSSQGIVTAVNYGEVVVTCTASDDPYIFAEATVTVVLPVEKLTITEPKITLLLSEQDPSAADTTLVCTVVPENAYVQDVMWASSDEGIATVDTNGNIHAVSPGTVKITATSKEETTAPKSASCTVTVLQAVSSIEIDASHITLNVRASHNLATTVLPENASKKNVTWESSDPSIATVSASGRVTAVAVGTTTITCTAADGSGVFCACDVTVIQMANSLKIDAASTCITLNKYETLALNVLFTPENVTNRELVWESSDPMVALVSSEGKVTAIDGGAATITCTASDGSGKTAKIDIYVPSIAVDNEEYFVISKSGLEIPFKYYGAAENLSITPESCMYFNAEMNQRGQSVTLNIYPEKAGTTTLTITDKSDRRNTVKLSITVEHSACYDSTSYPVGNYTNIMRSPSQYDGELMSVYGRVLQVYQGLFNTTLRVATQGRWDGVFYITCPNSMAEGIIEDDYITVYGECTGTETYSTVIGGRITIPSMKAEKIFLGRH